jgi:peptidyl-Asp metalloendopeptidase
MVMQFTRAVYAAPLVGCFLWFATGPARGQDHQESVELILSSPEGTARSSLRDLYMTIRQSTPKVTTRLLPLTTHEQWTVPKEKVDTVRKAAAKSGVVVSEIGSDWHHIFHAPPSDVALSDTQRSLVQLARVSKAITGIKLLAGPPPAMLEHALTKDANAPTASKGVAKITIALSDKTVVTATRTSVDIKSEMCIWRGAVEETGALVTLMLWPDGQMAGTIEHKGHFYSIRHLGDRIYAIVEMNEQRMPPEHAAMPPMMLVSSDPNKRDDPLVQQGDASILRPMTFGMRRRSAQPLDAEKRKQQSNSGIQKTNAPRGDIVVDVIVAFTEKAANNYADIKRELVELAIEEANGSFRMSNLGRVKLRLVHAYQTDYVEEGAHFDHVWRFADNGDGYMEEIHGLRDKYRADVAILIVDDPKGCGLATRVHADADEAFAVVHHECASTTHSIAHEIGHLIGARHDLSLDRTMTPFPYGHGYVNGTKWRDIMSYKESCGGCPRVPVWSSPKVLVKGEAAGTANLDNARVIAEQAARVAAFR